MFYGMNAWFLASLVLGALIWTALAAAPSWRRLDPPAGAAAYVAAWSRGGPVLAVATLLASGLGFAAAYDEPDPKWAAGAALMLAALFFTLLFMGRVGHGLRDAAADAETARREAPRLLQAWARLHLVRTALAALGVFFFIWAAH